MYITSLIIVPKFINSLYFSLFFAFLLFEFQLGKFLLIPCSVNCWVHQRHSSFLLQNILYLAFSFDSYFKFLAWQLHNLCHTWICFVSSDCVSHMLACPVILCWKLHIMYWIIKNWGGRTSVWGLVCICLEVTLCLLFSEAIDVWDFHFP